MPNLRVLAGTCALASMVSACQRPMPADEHMSHMSAGDLAAPAAAPSSASQGDLKYPASANNAPARLKGSNRHAEWVKIAWEPGSSDSLMAWIVYPATRAKTPVVVVVHEIFGLSTWVRGVADQVAAEGFIAIAPDLVSRVRGGPSADEISGDSARKIIGGVSTTERNKGIIAAANYAMSQPSAEQRYGVIGYCWGGTTVFAHAINGGTKGFGGGVAFYGLPYMTPAAAGTPSVPIADSLAKIKVPVMLLSGATDTRITAGMPSVDSTMKALGKSYVGINYESAEHGFLRVQDDPKTPPNPAVNAGNVAATKDGWPRTVEFLKKNLGLK